MTQNFIYLFALVVLPLIAQFRSWPPFSLFAITTATYAVIATISFAQGMVFLQQGERSESVYRDTYHVTFSGNYATIFALVLLFFAITTWFQERNSAMIYPNTTRSLFWILHIALLAFDAPITLFTSILSPLFGSNFERINAISTWASYMIISSWATYIIFFSCLMLVAIAVRSAIRVGRS